MSRRFERSIFGDFLACPTRVIGAINETNLVMLESVSSALLKTMAPSTETLIQLKRDIASSYPNFESRISASWREILGELANVVADIEREGPEYVPVVDKADLVTLDKDRIELLKRRGTFVVRNVVSREQGEQWRRDLRHWIDSNPNAEGTPADNPQYFQIFYTKPQVEARAHPGVLEVQTWCNRLYQANSDPGSVDLDTPLTYADRFRMRQPGFAWGAHPPHMDGGAIGRWSDPTFRSAFESILTGDWRNHNPYSLKGRTGTKTSTDGQPNQASIFRTFQGWLAVSDTGPGQGTLQVFPDVLLSTAYIMLRPFFSPSVTSDHPDLLHVDNWRFGEC